MHDLGYGAPCGLPELREAILAHVVVQRGVHADPAQVLILPSTSAALHLLARLCIGTGRGVVWMENPGYGPACRAFLDSGASLVAMPVDRDGADVSRMDGGAPALIYVTPSHQYPTGVTMTLPRRLALIEAAHRAGALVLEDDYDSEFLAGPSVAALQSIDRAGVVAYLGTFSKSLAPGLRTAYAIVPLGYVSRATDAQARSGAIVPIHVQAALADFISEGRLRTHVRRIAPIYRENTTRLVEVLDRECGGILSVGAARGGLQLATWFRDSEINDTVVAAKLAMHGFRPSPLSDYALTQPRPGLLFGTARVELARAELLARCLTELVTSKQRGTRTPGTISGKLSTS